MCGGGVSNSGILAQRISQVHSHSMHNAHNRERRGKKAKIAHKAASIYSCTQPHFVSNKSLSSKQFENFLCNSVSVYSV